MPWICAPGICISSQSFTASAFQLLLIFPKEFGFTRPWIMSWLATNGCFRNSIISCIEFSFFCCGISFGSIVIPPLRLLRGVRYLLHLKFFPFLCLFSPCVVCLYLSFLYHLGLECLHCLFNVYLFVFILAFLIGFGVFGIV